MEPIAPLRNPIMPYAWGSRTTIAALLGDRVPSAEPQAELWMGAHPKAPSWILHHGAWRPLDTLIAEDPEAFLGPRVVERFGTQLPFLFKLLAVEAPLSLQAHPDREQARAGFERENRQGIPLNAAERNYRDAQHKPECVCALTEFEALCGFRAPAEILERLAPLWPQGRRANLDLLASGHDSTLVFFRTLLELSTSEKELLLQHILGRIGAAADLRKRTYRWVTRLAGAYPGDIGALAPLLLNLLRLSPGQAIALPAGELHAYLSGAALELMANSDNVLRAGLTAKHVDAAELLRILHATPYAVSILDSDADAHGEKIYPSPFEEFRLSAITVSPDRGYLRQSGTPGPEIWLCVDGSVRVTALRHATPEAALALQRGRSLFVSAAAGEVRIEGRGVIYRATVPMAAPGA
jgi:mannose-6-phosphate isomerase